MTAISKISPAPWERHEWHGALRSVDGTLATDFGRDDVAEVIAFESTAERWEGETVAIVRLVDGRIAAWEATYGPTGDGFVCDAYGGDSDILFASSVASVLPFLSERVREMLPDDITGRHS